jgi:DNA-directed RNA polymerase subunit E'/Rpb7
MSAPYFNTNLYTTVSLHPSQMDNDIYKHLKNNLIRKLQGKCYKSYGYITKIYKIEERSEGKLIAEDNSASAAYDVKFSCKLCKPLKNTLIICEIIAINKSVIYLKNGPIHVFILDNKDNVNQNNFIFDERKNVLFANIGNNKGSPVVIGTFVKVKVIDTKIETTRIIVLGTMESLASKKESDESITIREHDDEFVDYDDYIKGENSNKDQEIIYTDETDDDVEEIEEVTNKKGKK